MGPWDWIGGRPAHRAVLRCRGTALISGRAGGADSPVLSRTWAAYRSPHARVNYSRNRGEGLAFPKRLLIVRPGDGLGKDAICFARLPWRLFQPSVCWRARFGPTS